MTVFADTSALVKLYIQEDGSEGARQQIEAATEVVVADVTYSEARAAFAARHRLGDVSRGEYAALKAAFEGDWQGMARLQITEAICREAGDLAERYGLRGYDGIQMACYALVARNAAGNEVEFACFDERLKAAIRQWVRWYRRAHS